MQPRHTLARPLSSCVVQGIFFLVVASSLLVWSTDSFDWRAHLASSSSALDGCSAVDFWDVIHLASSATSDAVRMVQGRHAVARQRIGTGSSVCILGFIEQPPTPAKEAAVSGYGPDDVHVALVSDDSIKVLPPLKPLFQVGGTPQSLPDGRLVYSASATVSFSGIYKVHGAIEYQGYDWVSERHEAPSASWINRTILDIEPSELVVVGDAADARSTARLKRKCYSDLPAHSPRTDGSIGTWHRAQSTPPSRHWDAIGPLVDDWGYEFVPDHCYLEQFAPETASSCLARKTIAVFGDSMWRRALKSLTSAGEFCLDPKLHCACNDWSYQQISGLKYAEEASNGFEGFPIHIGAGAKVWFAMMGGVAHAAAPTRSWQALLLPTAEDGSYDYDDPQAPKAAPVADAVLVSVGEWDSLDIRYRKIIEADAAFRTAIFAIYDASIPIIVRLPSPICCHRDWGGKNYTALRRHRISEGVRQAWTQAVEDEGEHRPVYFLNPTMAGRDRADVHVTHPCDSNHALFRNVAIENTHWLNMLCDGGRWKH